MTITTLKASGDEALVTLETTWLGPPEPGEATLAVEAASVNRGEILLLQAGRTDGHGKDVAGTVLTAAPDGSGPPAGTRVVAHLEGGGWAERVHAPAARLVPLPAGVHGDAAVTLGLAGLTALRLLRVVRAEGAERVLLTGAAGGVGHLFVELAVEAGVAVTAVTRSADRGARLRELGATVVTHSAAAGRGFDVALESIGGASAGAALAALRAGGLLLWFGQASGEPARLDFFTVAAGAEAALRIRPFRYWEEGEDAADLTQLVGLLAAGRLHPEIGLRADWHDAPAVLAAVRDRAVRGNAILEFGATA